MPSNAEQCRCGSKRVKLRATVGVDIATYFFMSFFRNEERKEVGLNESRVEESDEESDDGNGDNVDCPEQDEGTGRAQRHNDDLGAHDGWVKLLYHDVNLFEDQLEIMVELTSFCLVEAIGLGYFPFHTEEGYG